jgi:hypothetical protein
VTDLRRRRRSRGAAPAEAGGWWLRLVRSRWFAPLLLAACALLPYAGTWSYGFSSYDDDYTIVDMQGEALLRRALPRDESGDAHVALARFLADRGDLAGAVQL